MLATMVRILIRKLYATLSNHVHKGFEVLGLFPKRWEESNIDGKKGLGFGKQDGKDVGKTSSCQTNSKVFLEETLREHPRVWKGSGVIWHFPDWFCNLRFHPITEPPNLKMADPFRSLKGKPNGSRCHFGHCERTRPQAGALGAPPGASAKASEGMGGGESAAEAT